MPVRRGLYGGPGPWSPQLSCSASPSGYFVRSGPTDLDIRCKESLQKLLKPSNYPVIVPWMNSAGTEAKRDMVRLARHASGVDAEPEDPAKSFAASREPAIINSNGRPRLLKAVHVTADRVQSDMLGNRSGSEARDAELLAKRRFFAGFSPVPSRNSVSDFFRLGEVAVATDPTVQVLTEHARRKLHQWQVRGPEQDREGAARAMRSLRGLSEAVERLPKYAEHSAQQPADGEAGDTCTNSLHKYSKIVPKGHRILKAPAVPLRHSSSSPAVLQPIISQEDIEAVHNQPGGYLVHHADSAPLQRLKNQERAGRSRIAVVGGRRDWSTAAMAVGSWHGAEEFA